MPKRLPDVLAGSSNTHGEMKMLRGVVTAISTSPKTCTVALGPNDSNQFGTGEGITGVPYILSYTPALGDVVQMVSNEGSGLLIMGATGRVTLNAALPADQGGAEDPLTVVTRASTPYNSDPLGYVRQGANQYGVPSGWVITDFAAAIATARAAGIIIGFQVQLTLIFGGPHPILTLIDTAKSSNYFTEPHVTEALVLDSPRWVNLPLGWVSVIELNPDLTVGLLARDGLTETRYAMTPAFRLTVETT